MAGMGRIACDDIIIECHPEREMAPPAGFEPAANRLEGGRSIP
jgi:hypothetical protein